MAIQPLGDRVVVEVLEAKEKTQGGIFLPETAKEKPQVGKVIAVGKGRLVNDGKVVPLDVKIGDKILFGKYSGNEIHIDDKEYLIIKEEEIFGIVK